MQIEQLHPARRATTVADLVAAVRPWEAPPAGRPWIGLNMVASLDGKATLGGLSGGLSGDADRELFHLLRTRVDAVMVGAGTLRAERYGRLVKSAELRAAREREGLAPDPWAVIVSARLDLPADLPLLAAEDQRVIIATASPRELDGVRAHVEYLRVGDDLPVLAALLRERYGIRAVLCEGGPTLNAHLFAARLVDELFLTLSPLVLAGEGPTIVAGRPLAQEARLEPLAVSLVPSEGALLTRWRVVG
ncbi:dihydrofolate reductase family protein [Thermoleophilum album]|uniref:Riboflavin-specific deaminase C-terminal domain-containing protein n=1 Tax=Thermoleophilum album TaxID=29539 RepID=A0A1H6FK96_THEAL|nr:dihydrofolate reductase family protein [Thermoleophilum album]SEH10233.1 riboflavin-specific deaminase C-terminal domain-containing protein [Thermoleophilum album]